MKTRRISEGYYEGKYCGITFTITRLIDYTNDLLWYYQIGDSYPTEYYDKKKSAMEAVKKYIDSSK